jgi:hypothetical protein
MRAPETYEQQMADSDRIFTMLHEVAFENIEELRAAVVVLFIYDLSYSRAGISHALKRLEQHYTKRHEP